MWDFLISNMVHLNSSVIFTELAMFCLWSSHSMCRLFLKMATITIDHNGNKPKYFYQKEKWWSLLLILSCNYFLRVHVHLKTTVDVKDENTPEWTFDCLGSRAKSFNKYYTPQLLYYCNRIKSTVTNLLSKLGRKMPFGDDKSNPLTRYLVTKSLSITGHTVRLLSFLLCWLEIWVLAWHWIVDGEEVVRTLDTNSLCSLHSVITIR